MEGEPLARPPLQVRKIVGFIGQQRPSAEGRHNYSDSLIRKVQMALNAGRNALQNTAVELHGPDEQLR